MQKIQLKRIARDDWSRVLRRSTAWGDVRSGGFHAVTNLIRLLEVRAPLVVKVAGKVVDNGYAWMHVLPEGENWCLTTMFDTDGEIVQYYFDITLENVVDGESSRFFDLFLDVSVLPDGRASLLDEDELDEALAEGVITAEQANLARNTAEMLMRELDENFRELEEFCRKTYAELKK